MNNIFDNKAPGDFGEKDTEIVQKDMRYKMGIKIDKIVSSVTQFNSVKNFFYFILSFLSGKTKESKNCRWKESFRILLNSSKTCRDLFMFLICLNFISYLKYWKKLFVLLFFPTGLTLTVFHSNKKDFLESKGVLNG